jgi:peptide/nickel transport system substrate-binding protein
MITKNFRLIGFAALAVMLFTVLACSSDDDDGDTAAPAPAPAAPAPAAPAPAAPAPAAAPAATAVPEEDAMAMSDFAGTFKGTFVWDGDHPTKFSEAPTLAARVASGELPPVEERLPNAEEVMVVAVVDRIGDYGGTWRRAFTGPNDGQNADRLMMDMVLYYDLNGTEVIPNVAKGWDISDDGLVYTLYLREGMKWSDGVPFTSEDFVWHFNNVILDDEINPTREGQIGWSGVQAESMTAVDEYTVSVLLTERKDGFLDSLANYTTGGWTLHGRVGDGMYGPTHYLKTIHRKFAEDKDAFDKRVADAGYENWITFFKDNASPLKSTDTPVVSPWKMTSPITAEIYEWERNPYYWAVDPAGNQLPYIDRISMTLTGDKEILNLKASAGEIDFQHRHIEMAKVPVFKENEERSQIDVQFWGSHGAVGIAINMSYGEGEVDYEVDEEVKKWLNNFEFRKALSLAVDRNKINEVMFLGQGDISQPIFSKGHPFYPGDAYAQKYTELDPDQSMQILDSIGLKDTDGDGIRNRTDGKGNLVFIMDYAAEYFVAYDVLAELIEEDLAKVGIKVALKPMDVSLFKERRDGNTGILMAGGLMSARWPNLLDRWYEHGSAYRTWYTGGRDVYSEDSVAAEPTDPDILRLAQLADDAVKLRYADRKDVYVEGQRIFIDNLYGIGAVGNTPAFNGVIVKKKYFKNVPPQAPNESPLQNPGIARTVQFFIEGGKNDSE